MPLTNSEKRAYAKRCIVQSFLDWGHYKIKPSPGCFDAKMGKCKIETFKNPVRLLLPFSDKASDVMLYDACKLVQLEDTSANNLVDYLDEVVTKDDVNKHASRDARSPFW